MFKIEDIKEGYLLKLETEKKETFYATITNGRGTIGHTGDRETLGFCSKNQEHYGWLDEFNADLSNKRNRDYRIIAVYGRTYNRYLLDCSPERRELLWKREEPTKMTVAEICKVLGYDVEIVKEG